MINNNTMLWLNLGILTFNTVFQALSSNYYAAVGWFVALLWFWNYWRMNNLVEKYKETLDDAMEGWTRAMGLLKDNKNKDEDKTV